MRLRSRLALAALLAFGTAASTAQAADHRLVIEHVGAPMSRHITISSVAFAPGDAVPMKYSAYGKSISPPLKWDDVPQTTKSFALILEDPDAPTPAPFVHWIAFNIPADTRALPTGLPATPEIASPVKLRQGINGTGKPGYFGPMPPKGDGAHHYHFEIFALDKTLPDTAGKSRDALIAAISGHVLAEGEVIGTFTAPR
jgi:Raf kinase inhibitor-like YbhB/YbcL family protein